MAVKAFEGGRVQLFDKDTGAFLALGKVYVYEPGTTTLKNSYTTSDLSVANANPVVLDAYGRAEIWVSGNAKFVVTDASGGSEYTVDNYNRDESTSSAAYNLATNGSFETDSDGDGKPDNWTVTTYSGGTQTLDAAASTHGAQSLKFTSTGNGGGYVTQSSFQQVAVSSFYLVRFGIKSSVVDVRNLVWVKWYDADQVFISNSTVYDESTANPTSFTYKQAVVTSPANACFAKLELYGCHSSDATSGSTWFDDVVFTDVVIANGTNAFSVSFTGNNTAITSSTGVDQFAQECTDAGAVAGPIKELYRNSASPAASDEIGAVDFYGKDSGGNKTLYARHGADIVDPTDTSEDSGHFFETYVAGTRARRLNIRQGFYTPNATGGDKGVDTINASAIYDDGVQIVVNGWKYLGTVTATGAAQLDINSLITSSHKVHAIVIDALRPATSGSTFRVRLSTDNGSTFLSSATYLNGGIGSADTYFELATDISNNANFGLSGIMYLHKSAYPSIYMDRAVFLSNTTGYAVTASQGGLYNAAITPNSMRLYASSGNVTATVRVYGLRDS